MLSKLVRDLFGSRRKRGMGIEDPDRGQPLASDGLEQLLRQAERSAQAGQLNAALECYRRAARDYPQALRAQLGMGNTLVDLWAIEEAIAAYGKALELAPGSSEIFSAVLFHSHYSVPVDRQRLIDLHRQFGTMMRKANPPQQETFGCTRDPERRLRIGYVSPNFSRHSVGYFVEPVIRHHDRTRYEIYCYYTHPLADDTTARIRGLADGWRHIANAMDDAVERTMRDDGIDILVDLAGHSKSNRLGVFARKPAPVQMTWLGYPDTTGLEAIGYRITDQETDPAPDAERWHTERLSRIDDIFLCYQPPADSPPVRVHPNSASRIRFASFNNIAKLNPRTIENWAKILAAVSESSIVLKSAPLGFPDTVDRVLDCFDANGIEPGRVELHGWMKNRHAHLALYDQIDIALDTHPYNGTTTTCEALWMGVPVVTQAGSTHMSRVGAAILRCVGLGGLVAENPEHYADIAISLAQDQTRRDELRTSLRNRLLTSPLLDHAGFTRKLERHFRRSWAEWCSIRPAG